MKLKLSEAEVQALCVSFMKHPKAVAYLRMRHSSEDVPVEYYGKGWYIRGENLEEQFSSVEAYEHEYGELASSDVHVQVKPRAPKTRVIITCLEPDFDVQIEHADDTHLIIITTEDNDLLEWSFCCD